MAETSALYKISLVILCISLVLLIVGFSTTSWTVLDSTLLNDLIAGLRGTYDSTISNGLWRYCYSVGGIEQCAYHPLVFGSWITPVQVMMSMGLLMLIIVVVKHVMLLFWRTEDSCSCLDRSKISAPILTGLLIQFGVVLYIIKELYFRSTSIFNTYEKNFSNFGYSLYLSSFAGFGALLAAILLACDTFSTASSRSSHVISDPHPREYTLHAMPPTSGPSKTNEPQTKNYPQFGNNPQTSGNHPQGNFIHPTSYPPSENYQHQKTYPPPGNVQQQKTYPQPGNYPQQTTYNPPENYPQQTTYNPPENYQQQTTYNPPENYQQMTSPGDNYHQPEGSYRHPTQSPYGKFPSEDFYQ